MRRSAIAPWARFVAVAAITAFVLWPIGVTVGRAFTGRDGGLSAGGVVGLVRDPLVVQWFLNSLGVATGTALATVLLAAPAGYVLSRGRGRMVSAYSLTVFVIQSLPVLLFAVPLFLLFVPLGLVDNLLGVALVYVATVLPVGVWMMAAAVDAVPVAVEEAAWLDGCSIAGSFRRIVLPGSVSGIVSTAVFAFLLAWNEYLVAVVFLRSDSNQTLAIHVSEGSPQVAVIMMLPPVILFAVFRRLGGVWGAAAV